MRYIRKRSNSKRELFSMVEIVSERHEIILQYNNKNMHMIRISFYIRSSYLKRVKIMRHCRSYFRCSIRCCRQSKCHYREAHTNLWNERAKREAPSGLVNKQYHKKKRRFAQKDIEIRNSNPNSKHIQMEEKETGSIFRGWTILHK